MPGAVTLWAPQTGRGDPRISVTPAGMSEARPGDWRPSRLALVPGDSLSAFRTCRES